ncbi:MAG: glycosyltransferase family 4 protein [Candidatus Helarchaeota archaeon]
MNVLLIGSDYLHFIKKRGNLSDRLRQLSRYCNVYIIITSPRIYLKELHNDNIKIYFTNCNIKLLQPFKIVKIFIKKIKKQNIDVISTQDPFFLGLIGLFISKLFKIPLNIQIHGEFIGNSFWLNEKLINRLYLIIAKIILRRCNSIRVVSKRIKESLIRYLKIFNVKINVIPALYININYQNKIRNFPEEFKKWKINFDFVSLSIGKLDKNKNFELLIFAAQKIVQKYPKTLFIIIGDGPNKNSIKNLINKLNLLNNIKILPEIDFESLKYFYELCDVFILTSFSEGFGLVCTEAMYFGKPVIMTDTGCANEYIIDNFNGFVIPKNNISSLINRICCLIENKNERIKMGINGRIFMNNILKNRNFYYEFAKFLKETINYNKK